MYIQCMLLTTSSKGHYVKSLNIACEDVNFLRLDIILATSVYVDHLYELMIASLTSSSVTEFTGH